MSALFKLRDAALAGEFAKKYFGKSGIARIKVVKAPKLGRTYDIYEVGVVSPDGDFMVKGSSSFCFAEAFNKAGKYPDDHDPIYVRHQIGKISKAQEPEPEQVEMFS